LALTLLGVSVAPDPDEPESIWNITADSFRGQRSVTEAGELVNVHITHDSLDVTADRGRWDQTTETATLVGNVHLVDGTANVTCDSLVYVRPLEFGTLFGHVDARDGTFHATGDTAHLSRAEERVTLLGQVTILETRGSIAARRVDYDRTSGVAVARIGVVATEETGRTTVTGDRLVYTRATETAVVTGEPLLTNHEEGEEPMLVRGEELELRRAARIAEARRNVVIEQADMTAHADHALLDETGGTIALTGSPRATDASGDVSADTLLVWYEGNTVRRLEARGHVFLTQAPTAGERAGERIRANGEHSTAYFTRGVIDSVIVEGNAASDYVPSPAELAKGTGANYCRGDRIRLFLRNGEVERVRLEGSATGRYWFEKEGGEPADPRREPPDSVRTVDAEAGLDSAPLDSTQVHESPDTSRVERMLTLSHALPSAIEETEPAPADSATADSLAWVTRVRSLDTVTRPDSLFPGGVDEVTYGGESVEFRTTDHHIRLERSASIQYGDAWLRAGKIVFDVDEETIEATDGPKLSDGGNELDGVAMDYDVATRQGVVHSGRTEFEGGYYQGRRIKRINDDTLLVDRCLYSTCENEDPHFHFLAPQLKIRLRDKVIGRPVILHIAHIPILALPYFLFPIDKGRRSGILTPEIEVGFSDARGRFVRNLGYYWALSDYVDLMTWFDLFERSPRWITYMQSRYKKRYAYEGQVYASYSTSYPPRAPTIGTQASGTSNQWEFRARHAQDLDPGSSLKLDANFVSSKGFLLQQGLGTDIEQQVDRDLQSTLSYTKTGSAASLTALLTRRQDLEADSGRVEATSTLPSVSFSLTRRTIGRAASGRNPAFLPALSSVSWGYSSNAEQSVTTIKEGPTSRAFALRHDVSLSDNRKVIGTVNVQPRFSYSEFLFEKDREGNRWQRAGRWSAGVSANAVFYGTFARAMGPVVAFRHVMTPSMGFSYQPRIRGGDRFDPVGGIAFGGGARSRLLTLSVQNRYEAKVRRGEEVKKIADLASIGLSTSYNLEAEDKPLSPLSVSARMNPHSSFNVDASSRHDFYGEGMTSLSVGGNLRLSGSTAGALPAGSEFLRDGALPSSRRGLLGKDREATQGQPWSMSIGYTYSRGKDAALFQSTVQGRFSVSLTPKWAITYSANANLREKEITNQSLSVRRDLHCWQASFDRRFFGGSASYYFRIGVKDIQEIFYEERG
jgi:lipopolysaccharide assembly outer membrane protein LptD (OstA)